MNKRRAIVPITLELLHDILDLPANMEILSTFTDDPRNINLVVESLELPEIPNGKPFPKIIPAYKSKKAFVLVEFGDLQL